MIPIMKEVWKHRIELSMEKINNEDRKSLHLKNYILMQTAILWCLKEVSAHQKEVCWPKRQWKRLMGTKFGGAGGPLIGNERFPEDDQGCIFWKCILP